MKDSFKEIQTLFIDALQDASSNFANADVKAQKNTTSEGDVKLQTRIVNGNEIVWVEQNILKENKGMPIHSFVANFIAEHIGEAYTIIESGQKVFIGKDLPNEYTQSKYTRAILKNNPNIVKVKNRASSNLGEMIEIATNRRWEKTEHEKTKDAKYGMYRYDTRFGFPVMNTKKEVVGANIFTAELVIRNASDGKKYLYDIVAIKKDIVSSDWLTKKTTSATVKTVGQKNNIFSNSISNPTENVKENSEKQSARDVTYIDAVNRGDVEAAQELVDEAAKRAGYTQKVYHGTDSEFTEFNTNKQRTSGKLNFGKGIYLTPNKNLAEMYTETGNVMELYASVKNPYEIFGTRLDNADLKKLSTEFGESVTLDNVDKVLQKNGYDGIIARNYNGSTNPINQIVVFSSNQVKSADPITYDDKGVVIPLSERFNPEKNDIRYSERDYSYENLINKPNMYITSVNDKVTYKPTPIMRKSIVNQAIKNATSIGKTNENGNIVIHVDDIETDVIVSKSSLVHGLDRRLQVSAPVILNIGSVLKNAIRINELTPKAQTTNKSYVLIGYAESTDNVYIVRMVVNNYTNEMDSVDVLYAVNTKKETVGKKPGSHGKTTLPTVSTISISNLLEHVNRFFPDILPEDVLKHFGHTARPEGDLGESVLFSDRDANSTSARSLLVNSLEGTAQNEIERKKLNEYKSKIALIEAEQKKLTELRAEIKELSFAKGPRNTKKISKLQNEAVKTANRINIYDRQLLSLEATKPLQNVLNREKELAKKKQKQKDEEILKAYKEKVANERKETIEHYKESRKKAVEGRNKTELRHKIKKVVNDLNKLLLKGTKEKHVMVGLQKAVAAALDAINMDTVSVDERVAKYDALIAKETNPDIIASLTESRDRIQSQGDKLSEKLWNYLF